MKKWIGENPVRIVADFSDVSLISDNDECTHCGEKKEDIVTGPMGKIVYTEQNKIYDLGDEEINNPLCSSTIILTNDQTMLLELDVTPIGITEDEIKSSAYEFLNSYIQDLNDKHKGVVLKIEGTDDVSIQAPVAPYSEVGRPNITNPCLPKWATICPVHGTELQNGPYLDPYTVEMFCSGYVSCKDEDVLNKERSWYDYIHKHQGSEINKEMVPDLYDKISEESRCCSRTRLTFEADTNDSAEEMHSELLDHVEVMTSEIRDDIINPLDDIGFPSTEEIIPFFYKHGSKGVDLWNKVYGDIFASVSGDEPFILNPTRERKEYVESSQITELEYVEMVKDLMDILEFSNPQTGTPEQEEKIEKAYSNLGYDSSVLDFEPQQILWMNQNPMGSNILRFMSEQTGQKNSITGYFDSYDRLISEFNKESFSYDGEELIDSIGGDIVSVPLENLGRFSYPSDISVLARIESYNYVPQVDESVISEFVDEYNGQEPNLPKAIWLNPVGISIKEQTQTSIRNIYNLARELDSKGKNSWIPATSEILEECRYVENRIPPSNDENLQTVVAGSVDETEFESISAAPTAESESFDSLVDVINDNKDDLDLDIDEISIRISSVNVDNYAGWYTLAVLSEFPAEVSGQGYERTASGHYVSSYINFVSEDDEHIRGYKPVWEDIFDDVDKIRSSSTEHIEEVMEEDNVDPSGEIILVPIQNIVVSESSLETVELDLD